ncbi:disintegrin and metalloproteinase domain-containing protein 1a-like [Monodelphis domestica]|uniref:Disintegrin and metalloproteinase domain-containing protein 1a-like n=1 Tax=Monodelphis domestica TaxID=13616 RepID=F7DI19_MONDO|nr:disintegrin and metalloproteinase domain-containing protein 1a-like [Monodelphis domestica]
MNELRKKYLFQMPQKRVWGLGLGSSTIGLGFFFLCLGMLLPGIPYAQGYYSYYEIVIPRKLTESLEKISYALLMKGKRQVIQLNLKRGLFVKDFPVYTYTKETLDLDMPFIQDDCYYDGYVEGQLGSLVSLSTCSGLKGVITIDKSVYRIEPIGTSKEFEHVLYHMDGHVKGSCKVSGDHSKLTSNPQLRRDEDNLNEESQPVQFLNYVWSHTKYLEMFVVVDNKRFQMWNSNVTKTAQMVMDALAHVNTYVWRIKLKVVLIGLEIWTEKDQVKISEDLQEVLYNFNHWREQVLFIRAKHDVAHLIVGHDPGEYIGEAFFSGACVSKFAAGVETFYHEDVSHFALLMVHELGHNLGMEHDHESCICFDHPSCIMLRTITFENNFSNCSLDYFYEFLRQHKGSCLYDKPVPRGLLRKPFCGNHVVDKGEECDCGSHGDCRKDQCCLPSCQMRMNSDCAFGPCCKKCKFLKAATPCRPSVDECDLPEYCNGTSMWCQPDTYKQDGTPCRGPGYCYQGRCRSVENQCVQIFGEGSRAARKSCYHLLNTQGDRFGNCGSNQKGLLKVFVKCNPEDVMCGRLLCEDIPRLPQTRNHHTLIQIPIEGTWCWGMDLFEDMDDDPDGGAVKAGTSCGPQKICINRTCSDLQVLQSDCKSEVTCRGRGVCNNLKHCHCDYGYAPPTCDSKGFGGSVDSGPTQEAGIAPLSIIAPGFPERNNPPTQAVHLNFPRAIRANVESDIIEDTSEDPLISFGPTVEIPPPIPTTPATKKIPAALVLISALIINIILLLMLLSFIFVVFFCQKAPPIICERQEKKP